MAFKSLATANISVIATPTTVTPTITTGQTATLIGLSLANTTAANITVGATLTKSGGSAVYLVKDATVLPGGALVVVGGDQKLVLEAGDVVKCYASATSSADAIVSYLI